MDTVKSIINHIKTLEDYDKFLYISNLGNLNYKKVLDSFNEYRSDYYFEIVLLIVITGIKNGCAPVNDLKYKGAFLIFDEIKSGKIVIETIAKLLKIGDALRLPDNDIEYFRNKVLLGKVLNKYIKDVNNSINDVIDLGYRAVLDVLTYCSFSYDKNQSLYSSIELDYNNSQLYSYIEWYDGASLFLKELFKDSRLKNDRISLPLNNMHIEKILKPFIKISKLREYEMYVDYFDYSFCIDNNRIIIDCSNAPLAKAIDLGYIMDNLSFVNVVTGHEFNKNNNIESLASFCLNNKFITLQRRNDYGYKRYSFVVNNAVNILLSQDFLLEEETYIRDTLIKELLISYDEYKNFRVSNEITLFDITRFRRIFVVLSEILKRQGMSEEEKYNTLTQPLTKDMFKRLLGNNFDELKVDELIDLFDFNNPNNIKDLLYSPIIKINDRIIASIDLIGYSSLERNAIQTAKKRAFKEDKFRVINNRTEYVEDILERACKLSDIHIITNVEALNYSYNGLKGEIDALIYDDGNIIIVECKSPTSSTNGHELKAIFDYLKKAEKQLDLSLSAFSDPAFYNQKLLQLGISIKPRKIHTLICNTTRSFNGYKMGVHPVRSIKELYNYLETGIIDIDGKSFLIKKGNNSYEQLLDYISDSTFIYDLIQSLVRGNSKFYYGGYNFIFNNYSLSVFNLKNIFNQKYSTIKNDK